MEILNILSSITILFFVVLIFKQFLPKKTKEKICVICVASTLTWIFLLIKYHQGTFNNIIIISLLSGLTTLGIFYTWEMNAKKQQTFFRLPVLLSLILATYFLLTLETLFKELIFLIFIWAIFISIYNYKSNKTFKTLIDKVIECCKNW